MTTPASSTDAQLAGRERCPEEAGAVAKRTASWARAAAVARADPMSASRPNSTCVPGDQRKSLHCCDKQPSLMPPLLARPPLKGQQSKTHLDTRSRLLDPHRDGIRSRDPWIRQAESSAGRARGLYPSKSGFPAAGHSSSGRSGALVRSPKNSRQPAPRRSVAIAPWESADNRQRK
jgi:hypothetical protein